MDYRLSLITGIDIPISELQINIHQPTIKEISYIGEEAFFIGLQYLTVNKYSYIQNQEYLKSTTNFEIFITIINDEKFWEQKNHVNNLLTLLFPEYKIALTPQSIILINQNNNNTILIDKNNFHILQEYIKNIFCLSGQHGQNAGFNPKGKKAKEIADKIMKGRKKISEEKGEGKESIFSRYVSILAIGSNKPLSELINLTIFQLYDLIERYQLYVSWDIDIRSRLAGAKNENKPENWMKNIH